MATSPNYSWPEPDNTDLVKNGALAMRTLGNAIDTTMATMTPKSTVTAKGSLIAATAASTPANLAVGNNGETLVADSSTSTGLRYTAGTVQANPVLNSAMQVWQRGTSFTGATTGFCADRWNAYRGVVGSTFSRQTTNDTTNLPFIQYATRVQRNSGNTATDVIVLFQDIETVNSIPFAGKTVTLSFYARAGANYSASSSILEGFVFSGTGTDQSLRGGYTGQTAALSTAPTLTTTWQRFTATGSIASTVTQLGVYFRTTPTGTAGVNDWFEITGVQLDIGSVALPFRTYAGTIQGELAACQRYYYRSTGVAYAYHGNGYASATNEMRILVEPKVPLRVAPSSVETSSPVSTIVFTDGVALPAASSVAVSVSQPDRIMLICGSTSLTQYRPYSMLNNATASSYIAFSAEL